MSSETTFTKENLDYYLKELAKEFKKRNGTKMIRTIRAEYLVAMKLVSGRKYKKESRIIM